MDQKRRRDRAVGGNRRGKRGRAGAGDGAEYRRERRRVADEGEDVRGKHSPTEGGRADNDKAGGLSQKEDCREDEIRRKTHEEVREVDAAAGVADDELAAYTSVGVLGAEEQAYHGGKERRNERRELEDEVFKRLLPPLLKHNEVVFDAAGKCVKQGDGEHREGAYPEEFVSPQTSRTRAETECCAYISADVGESMRYSRDMRPSTRESARTSLTSTRVRFSADASSSSALISRTMRPRSIKP